MCLCGYLFGYHEVNKSENKTIDAFLNFSSRRYLNFLEPLKMFRKYKFVPFYWKVFKGENIMVCKVNKRFDPFLDGTLIHRILAPG